MKATYYESKTELNHVHSFTYAYSSNCNKLESWTKRL